MLPSFVCPLVPVLSLRKLCESRNRDKLLSTFCCRPGIYIVDGLQRQIGLGAHSLADPASPTTSPKPCYYSGEVSVPISGRPATPGHYIAALRPVRSSMGKKGLVVVTSILAVLTIVFGVISAVLLALKHHQNDQGEYSTYRRSPAMPCGVVAAVLASMTQILASVAICCCGAWRMTKGAKRIAAVVFFITSWVLAIIAVLLFLAGAMLGFEGSAKKTVGNARIVGGVAIFVIATFMFLVVAALDVASYRIVRKKAHYQAYVGTTSKDAPYASAPAPPNQV